MAPQDRKVLLITLGVSLNVCPGLFGNYADLPIAVRILSVVTGSAMATWAFWRLARIHMPIPPPSTLARNYRIMMAAMAFGTVVGGIVLWHIIKGCGDTSVIVIALSVYCVFSAVAIVLLARRFRKTIAAAPPSLPDTTQPVTIVTAPTGLSPRACRFWAIAMAIAGACSLASVIGDRDWSQLQPIVSGEGGFSILLPEQPQRADRTNGIIITRMLSAKTECQEFGIAWTKYPAAIAANLTVRQILDNMERGSAACCKGSVRDRRDFMEGHCTVREVTIAMPGKFVTRIRLYVATPPAPLSIKGGCVTYQVIATARQNHINDPHVQQVFDSFKRTNATAHQDENTLQPE